MTIGLTLLALALYKAIAHWKLLGINSYDLITVIVRDQIIYYIMWISRTFWYIYQANQIKYRLILCGISTLTYYIIMSTKRIDLTKEYKDPGLYTAFILGSIGGLLSLFGSRTFLNLKEASGSRSKGATSPGRNTITTMSAVRFASLLLHSRAYINLIFTFALYFTDFF